jgi:hypothetical protein
MPHFNRNRRNSTAAAVLFVLLAALLLSACGGSSKSSSSTASSSASATTATGPARGKGGTRNFTALRECLQKSGITLPKSTPSQPGKPGAGGVFGAAGGPALPKGVTRTQLREALKKCAAHFVRRAGKLGGLGGTSRRFAKFATCMGKAGVKLPAPNTSGKGPIFDTKGLNTSSAQFKAADAKCAAELTPTGAGAPPGAPEGAPATP